MGIWSRVRQGLGATKRRAVDHNAIVPTFEKLEERILLSADPLGLVSDNPYHYAGFSESAIVVDFDLAESVRGEEQGADPIGAEADYPAQVTSDEQSIGDALATLSLSDVQAAADLPATQLNDVQTLTETALPPRDGTEITSEDRC